jgi:integrase
VGRLETWAKPKGLRMVSDFETTHAIAWKEWLMGQGHTGRNLNQHLIIARSVFRHVRFVAGIQGNPFDGVTGVQEATVHRAPLSEEQVAAAIAKVPDHARGVMVCGACTAMRMGDCCRLTWGSVDLDAGFITVKTHKSGARVEIPILPDLAVELKKAGGGGAEDAFVWPEMAEFYRRSPGLVSALFMRAFDRASISTTVKRESKRAANVAGFHALRTTWITRALSAGVPTELVRRVSGHSGVEVVLKHYFQPGRAELKDAILKAFKPTPAKKKGKAKK